jgi:hypothetical protein
MDSKIKEGILEHVIIFLKSLVLSCFFLPKNL